MADILDMKRRLARLLVEKSYKEGQFTLTSGRRSDYYFDGKQTALHPEGGWLIGHLFNDLLADVPGLVAVGGMTLGADPLVSATSVISYELKRPLAAFIVRKTPKGHGTMQYLEGLANLTPGAPVAMLEDVVTTGGSLLTACERVREAGFSIAAVCTVLDREEGAARPSRPRATRCVPCSVGRNFWNSPGPTGAEPRIGAPVARPAPYRLFAGGQPVFIRPPRFGLGSVIDGRSRSTAFVGGRG